MITRIHLWGIGLTWVLLLLLIPCLNSVPGMIVWFFLATCYMFVILAGLFDLHRLDARLPKEDDE